MAHSNGRYISEIKPTAASTERSTQPRHIPGVQPVGRQPSARKPVVRPDYSTMIVVLALATALLLVMSLYFTAQAKSAPGPADVPVPAGEALTGGADLADPVLTDAPTAVPTATPEPAPTAPGCAWHPYAEFGQAIASQNCMSAYELGLSQTVNGMLIYRNSSQNRGLFGFSQILPGDATGIALDVQVRRLVGGEIWIGLAATDDPLISSVVLIIQEGGSVDVRRYSGGVFGESILVDNAIIPYVSERGYRLRILMTGTRIEFVVNDRKVSTVELTSVDRRLFLGYRALPRSGAGTNVDALLSTPVKP